MTNFKDTLYLKFITMEKRSDNIQNKDRINHTRSFEKVRAIFWKLKLKYKNLYFWIVISDYLLSMLPDPFQSLSSVINSLSSPSVVLQLRSFTRFGQLSHLESTSGEDVGHSETSVLYTIIRECWWIKCFVYTVLYSLYEWTDINLFDKNSWTQSFRKFCVYLFETKVLSKIVHSCRETNNIRFLLNWVCKQ